MRASRSRIAAVAATALAVLPSLAAAQLSNPQPAQAYCGGSGRVTIVGPTPNWNAGSNVHVRIGVSGTATSDIVNDDVARIGQMSVMANSMGSAAQYATAIQNVVFTPPQNVSDPVALQQYQAAAIQQATTLVTEEQSLQSVGVDPATGKFTCANITPGTYTMIADVMRNVPPTTRDQQHLWGARVPNEWLYDYSFSIGTTKQPQTINLSSLKWRKEKSFGP